MFAQLIDFGFAADALPGHDFITRTFMGGTKDYLSPESLAAHYRYEDGILSKVPKARIKVGFKSDIWALGVILFQLTYGGVAPFSHEPGGRESRIGALINPDRRVEFEPIDDDTLIEAMSQSLEKLPEKRATASRLLMQEFLRPNAKKRP